MRTNGTFKYSILQEAVQDPETGFYQEQDNTEWQKGCECQIDKSIPAKQYVGTDGITYAYTYDVFIPKHFKGDLSIGTKIMLVFDDGGTDEFSIQGIDNLNRRYIEIWG